MSNFKLKNKLTFEQFEKLIGSRERYQYKLVDGMYVRSMRRIAGVYKAWLKAPKFLLQLDADLNKRMFLTKDLKLTDKRSEAMKFAVGFDSPVIKCNHFSEVTKLKLKVFYEQQHKGTSL